MTTIIIGSTAAQRWIEGFRNPKDHDMFSDQNPDNPVWGFYGSGVEIRYENFWHPSFADYWNHDGIRVANLDELYTIKLSHSAWDLHGTWVKHMEDAARFKREGAELLPDLYTLLYKVWEEKHGKKKVNLNMDASDFFDDAVKRVYDHDSIHRSVAYFDHPLYEDVMADGQSVKTDMRKVWALPFDLQVKLFREEIYATALERIVIPRNYKCSFRAAYAWALRRTVTSLTKGKSSLFIADNYELFKRPDCDYVSRHRANSHLLIKLKGK